MSERTNPTAPRTPEPVDLGTMSVEELASVVRSGFRVELPGTPDDALDELCRRAALAAERSVVVVEEVESALRFFETYDDNDAWIVACQKLRGAVVRVVGNCAAELDEMAAEQSEREHQRLLVRAAARIRALGATNTGETKPAAAPQQDGR